MVSTKKFSEFDDGGDDRDITAVGLEGGVNKKWENTPIMAPSGNTASRPATPTIPSLRYNTDFGQLEYWDGANWFQIEDAGDIASLIARLAAHTVGDGASMIGLQNQGAVSNKTVQDLAEADFIVRNDTSSLVNAIALSALATGLLVVENGTGNLIPRSIAGTSSQITINNGTGLAGNPTVSIAANPEIPGNADIQIPSGTTAQRPGMSLGGMIRYNTTLHAFEFYDATDLVWKQPVSLSVAMTNGQLIIGSTGNNPVVSTLTAGAGITISNAPGSITISGGGGGYSWTEVTGTSQQMAVNNGYIANNVALVTLPLPVTADVSNTVIVQGKGTGLFRIAQNAGQTIHFGNMDTTTGAGGYIESTAQYDSIELVCITANTDWAVLTGTQGVFTVA